MSAIAPPTPSVDDLADVSPRTVLLVNSNTSVLDGLACLIAGETPRLRLAGAVSSAVQALELVARVRPDVAVLDVNLGMGDGLELLSLLAPQVPVVVLTCHDSPRIRERAFALGAGAFVHKAAPAEQLLAAILEVGPVRSPLDAARGT